MKGRYKRNLLVAASAISVMAAAGPAFAQANPAQDDASQGGGLEEIIVTAQKRSENLQKVPIAITAVTASQLAQAGIKDTTDLTMRIPSLNFSRTAVYANPFIRGIGTDSFGPGNEASVATYVDGVYIANMNASTFNFNNIERVEVLKGPQGTLYGRNSVGGLISVITRTPTQDFQLKASMGYGNFQAMEASGYIAGGIAPNVAADFAIQFRDQGKGYYPNLSPVAVNQGAVGAAGTRVSSDSGVYLRSKLAIDFSDAARLVLSGDYSNFHNSIASNRQPAPGNVPVVPAGGIVSLVPGQYAVNTELSDNEDYGASANLSIDLGSVNFVSITAYRWTHGIFSQDSDDTSAPFSYSWTDSVYEQFSQELQLTSGIGSSFDWIIGLYYLTGDAGYRSINQFRNNLPATVPAILSPPPRLFSATDSVAAFGQVSFKLGQDGKLTLGGRYTYDKKDFRRSYLPNSDESTSWERPTWRIAYDHQIGDSLVYASYNRGYKSGTYNTVLGAPPPVDPEVLDAFEVGLKTDMLDNRVRLNVAGFYSIYKDIQLRAQNPGNIGATLQNAASARIHGVDGDLFAALTDDLQLQVGFSWIHGRYKSFPFADVFVPNVTPQGVVLPGNVRTQVNASGNPLVRTPEFSGSIGLRYDHEFDDASRLYGSANVFISDDVPWEPNNRVVTDGYAVVNASIGYTFRGGIFSLEAWARNLTDTTYENYVVPASNADRTSYAPPRTYGATAKVVF